MKQVTKKTAHAADKNIVEADRATISRYYGVVRYTDKGFVTADTHKGGYKVVMINGLTYANNLVGFREEELRKTISRLLASYLYVFEFDTPEQLCAWLAGVHKDKLRRVVGVDRLDEVQLDDVTPSKYYGSLRLDGGARGVDHVRDIRGVRRFVTPTALKEALSESMLTHDVYEFDTLQELFQWITEEPNQQ